MKIAKSLGKPYMFRMFPINIWRILIWIRHFSPVQLPSKWSLLRHTHIGLIRQGSQVLGNCASDLSLEGIIVGISWKSQKGLFGKYYIPIHRNTHIYIIYIYICICIQIRTNMYSIMSIYHGIFLIWISWYGMYVPWYIDMAYGHPSHSGTPNILGIFLSLSLSLIAIWQRWAYNSLLMAYTGR
jgi:hypothetical protein